MSIVYPLSFPAGVGIRKFKWTRSNITAATKGPFSGQAQIFQWPGEWWEFDAGLPPLARRQAELVVAFLTALRGQTGTFLFGDPLGVNPQGAAQGAPTPEVNGSNPAGSITLATKDWKAAVPGQLLAGDLIQVQASGAPVRLYKNLTDQGSDASGNMTLDIFPALRETLTGGQGITTVGARGTFRLTAEGNRQSWDIDQTMTYGIDFKAEEAI